MEYITIILLSLSSFATFNHLFLLNKPVFEEEEGEDDDDDDYYYYYDDDDDSDGI